ncbi:MAG: hypothetical protein WBD63_05200 [Phycisphaerae bacterium]
MLTMTGAIQGRCTEQGHTMIKGVTKMRANSLCRSLAQAIRSPLAWAATAKTVLAFGGALAMILAVAATEGCSEGPPPSAPPLRLPAAQLGATSEKTRLEANRQLITLQAVLVEDLKAVVLHEEGRAFQGPRHLAIQQMGIWRLKEAVPLLVDQIDWTLDKSTFPVGDRLAAWAYYPAATALRHIGGREARGAVIEAAVNTDDDRRLRLFGWVLFESDGRKIAEAAVTQRLEGVTNKEMRSRLEKLRAYVAQGGSVFLDL